MTRTILAKPISIDPPAIPASGNGGRIGPNAVTRLAEALAAARLEPFAAWLFAAAGHSDWLVQPPSEMLPEAPVAQLHQALRLHLPPELANAVLGHAGRLTADYLLNARIPAAAQRILKILPPRLAAMALTAAIGRNAWTFAGSGRFSHRWFGTLSLMIAGNPLCAGEHADMPVCAWHRAVFQRLFETLVSPRSRVVETHCLACGDECCRFTVDWRPQTRRRRHAI